MRCLSLMLITDARLLTVKSKWLNIAQVTVVSAN